MKERRKFFFAQAIEIGFHLNEFKFKVAHPIRGNINNKNQFMNFPFSKTKSKNELKQIKKIRY